MKLNDKVSQYTKELHYFGDPLYERVEDVERQLVSAYIEASTGVINVESEWHKFYAAMFYSACSGNGVTPTPQATFVQQELPESPSSQETLHNLKIGRPDWLLKGEEPGINGIIGIVELKKAPTRRTTYHQSDFNNLHGKVVSDLRKRLENINSPYNDQEILVVACIGSHLAFKRVQITDLRTFDLAVEDFYHLNTLAKARKATSDLREAIRDLAMRSTARAERKS